MVRMKRTSTKQVDSHAMMMLAILTAVVATVLPANRRMAAVKDRPSVGGDWGNTRYSALRQVNTGTVKDLGAAWTVKLNAAGTSSATVVANGRMFVTAGADIFAIDPASGRVVWSYEPPAPPSRKGVAVGGGRIYVGLADATLIALDQRTGALLWRAEVGDEGWKGVTLGRKPENVVRKPAEASNTALGQYIAAAPAYVDEMVIVGLANGDFGLRGAHRGHQCSEWKTRLAVLYHTQSRATGL